MALLLVNRTDRSLFGRWWWTVDRPLLAGFGALAALGILLVASGSPAVADRISGLSEGHHFTLRHVMFLVPAMALMLIVSMLDRITLRRLCLIGMVGMLGLLALTLVMGMEAKGAVRWIRIAGFSVQPSEFTKPLFAVSVAWLLSQAWRQPRFPGFMLATLLVGTVTSLLLLQPDFGQTVLIGAIWFAQIMLAGLPLIAIILLVGIGVGGVIGAYHMLDHVRSRIDRFLNPESGDNYQISTALDAFREGGLLGTGPFAGEVKLRLPDAHADFIFAVAGEELGLIAGLLIVGLYAFIGLRAAARLRRSDDLFVLLAGCGLLTQIGLQALIHMASNLALIPTKGMTLPFLSYGGSSLVALGLGAGILLALTRSDHADAPDRGGQLWRGLRSRPAMGGADA